ncbi:MAG: trehalase family glycosidase, partial [Salinibacter sp.]
WAGVASQRQARRLVETMTDPSMFWRPYGLPSLAANDPFYDPKGYWNGPVWVQWQYLAMRGLLNYGYEAEARELTDRVLANVVHQLEATHTFWEFYSPETHWGGHHQTYIWTGIIARMLIDLHRHGR